PTRLVRLSPHPHRRAMTAPLPRRQRLGVPAVRLHPIPRLHRHQGWSHHVAVRPQTRQLPVQNVPRRPCLVTESQPVRRSQPLHQPPHRLGAVRDRPQETHLTVRLHTATAIVSACTSNPTYRLSFFIDRLLSHVALRYVWSRDPQRNLRAANRSRSFHSD